MQEHLRKNFTVIGVIVSPTIVAYTLYAPDGQIYKYDTKDIVSVYPSYPSNNARLVNGNEPAPEGIRVPIPDANLDPAVSSSNETLVAEANKKLKDQLTELGASDRTLIYLTSADDITLTLVN
jgi:hypothetical protein